MIGHIFLYFQDQEKRKKFRKPVQKLFDVDAVRWDIKPC